MPDRVIRPHWSYRATGYLGAVGMTIAAVAYTTTGPSVAQTAVMFGVAALAVVLAALGRRVEVVFRTDRLETVNVRRTVVAYERVTKAEVDTKSRYGNAVLMLTDGKRLALNSTYGPVAQAVVTELNRRLGWMPAGRSCRSADLVRGGP